MYICMYPHFIFNLVLSMTANVSHQQATDSFIEKIK